MPSLAGGGLGAMPGADGGSKIPARRERRKPGEPDDEYMRWDELANAWDDSGRSDNMLLGGKTIKEAELWYARSRNRDPKPTTLHREFIEASKNLKRKKAIRIAGFVGAGLGTIALGGLVAKLLIGSGPGEPDKDDDDDDKKKTTIREDEPEVYAVANKAAADAIATAETDPRTAALIAAAALHIVAGTPVVAGSDPDRALRTSLGQTRGRALVDELNAGSGKAVTAVALSPTGDKAIATTGKDAKVWDLAKGSTKPLNLRGHQGPIELAEVSPDGRWLVTTAEDRTIRLWDLRADDPGTDSRILRAHSGKVDALDFSTDGRWMISSSSEDGRPRIWDLHAADPTTPTASLSGHEGTITDVAIAGDGSAAYTCSDDMSVKIWALDNGRVGKRITLNGHEAPVLAVDVSNDGHWLISTSQDMTARMWNLSSAAPWRNPIVLLGHKGPVNKVAITPDSKLAVTASSDNTLRIWELGAKDPSASGVTFKGGHTQGINDLRVDASSSWAVTAGKDAKVIAWNLAKRALVVESVEFPGHTRDAKALGLSADGRWLISGSSDGNAYVWDYRGGQDSSNGNYFAARSHTGPINDIDVSRDGKRFLSVGGDNRAVLWEFEPSGRPYPHDVLVGHEKAINAAALAPGGRYAATAGQGQDVMVWDIVKDKPSETVKKLEGHEGEIMDLAFTSDGARLFSCATDKSVRAWTAEAGWAGTELIGHNSEVVRLAVSPDDRYLISADITGQVMTWNLEKPLGKFEKGYQPHEGEIWALEFSGDGKWMLSGSADRNARLWTYGANGLAQKTVILRGHDDTINSASFSNDGKWVATGSRDGTVRLWDLASEHPEEKPRIYEMSNSNGVEWVHFGPDSERLYTGNGDGTVHIWYPTPSVEGRDDHQVLEGHEKKVSALAMPIDGSFLLTGSYDGTARVWPMSAPEMVRLGCYAAGRSPSEQEWQTWLPSQPYNAICG
ncbi:WD domain, G-beta repeat [Enhygromyxa salina]|uniref:WD domain, G-beta repeat n=1 Tax=Enhygromyxa salina TaxID=215803 RepID=A0A2S9XDJ0_9BACT|nr:WD40 repeat domain-containing protein [Enhygromyxa salina]PRP90922.1 WD domain, G-beta repeat [Enhygromyxa salina]